MSREITQRRVWDSNPRGSSRLLAIFKTSHAIILTCTDALPKDSLGAYSARPGGPGLGGRLLIVTTHGERRQARQCPADYTLVLSGEVIGSEGYQMAGSHATPRRGFGDLRIDRSAAPGACRSAGVTMTHQATARAQRGETVPGGRVYSLADPCQRRV